MFRTSSHVICVVWLLSLMFVLRYCFGLWLGFWCFCKQSCSVWSLKHVPMDTLPQTRTLVSGQISYILENNRVECINMLISTVCHFCHQKREFDVTLMHDMWMMCFTTGTFQMTKSRKYHHMQSFVMHQNDIKFSFPMVKVTKYGNLHVDTVNNTKYRFLWKLYYVQESFHIYTVF